MSFSITCPQCLSVMRYTKPPARLRKVKCPKCGFGMTIPAEDAHPSVFPGAKGPPPPPGTPGQRPPPAPTGGPPPMPGAVRSPGGPPGPPQGFAPPAYPQQQAYDEGGLDFDGGAAYYRPSARGGGKKGLIIGLIVGVVLLLAGGGLLLFFFVLKGPSLVGEWKAVDSKEDIRIQFTSDGKMITRLKGGTMEVPYKVVGQTIEYETPLGKQVISYRFEGSDLLITGSGEKKEVRLRRV